jgi:hypothetical protein
MHLVPNCVPVLGVLDRGMLQDENPGDRILRGFQSSLRNWLVSKCLPRTASWARRFKPKNLAGKRHWQVESWKDRLRIEKIIHPHDLLA